MKAIVLSAVVLIFATFGMADTVVINITNTPLVASPGSTVTVYGTITNNGSDEIFSNPNGVFQNLQGGTQCCGYDITGFVFDTMVFDVAPLSTTNVLPLLTFTVAQSANVGDVITGDYRAILWDEYNLGEGQVGINNYYYPQFADWQITVTNPPSSQAPVPEPSDALLLTAGLALLGCKKLRDIRRMSVEAVS